ncbi:MAG: hypothetical protein U5M23_02715 [Marinagarivorans sp.]|nr:hypothetical protein [Marinagarivorans sp.]
MSIKRHFQQLFPFHSLSPQKILSYEDSVQFIVMAVYARSLMELGQGWYCYAGYSVLLLF